MNNHIIIDYKPFIFFQNILVYVNGACVENMQVPIEGISNAVKELKNKYDITRIDLCGNSDYLSKFKSEIADAINDNNLTFSIYKR